MFHTKVVGKIINTFSIQYFFPEKSWRFSGNVEKYGRAEQSTDENIIRRIKDSILMSDNWSENTDTHS